LLSEALPTENIEDVASPYYMFKYSVRTELTRKYYERRIRIIELHKKMKQMEIIFIMDTRITSS